MEKLMNALGAILDSNPEFRNKMYSAIVYQTAALILRDEGVEALQQELGACSQQALNDSQREVLEAVHARYFPTTTKEEELKDAHTS